MRTNRSSGSGCASSPTRLFRSAGMFNRLQAVVGYNKTTQSTRLRVGRETVEGGLSAWRYRDVRALDLLISAIAMLTSVLTRRCFLPLPRHLRCQHARARCAAQGLGAFAYGRRPIRQVRLPSPVASQSLRRCHASSEGSNRTREDRRRTVSHVDSSVAKLYDGRSEGPSDASVGVLVPPLSSTKTT